MRERNDLVSEITPIVDQEALKRRRKRVKRMKIYIIITVIILLILPTIFCMFLAFKINDLQEEIALLKVLHKEPLEELVKDNEQKSNNLNGGSMLVYASGRVKEDTKEDIKGFTADSKKDFIDNPVDSSETLKKEETTLDSVSKSQTRKVYLTFDDGPSANTGDILDILKKENVKATFFVLGKTDKYSEAMYKRIVKEGHVLGMHSYSHDYNNIYSSVEAFDKDFKEIKKLLYDVTGYDPIYYRFPGGSSTSRNKIDMKNFIEYLNENDITYFDWNVMNGDAVKDIVSTNQLFSNVMSGIGRNNDSIVLMHDTSDKTNTRDSLVKLIKELKKQDFEILPIDDNTVPIQHIKKDSVKVKKDK